MSFDDGSLGDRGKSPQAGGRRRPGKLRRLWSLPALAVRRLRRHVRAWPGRYVDQQAALYEDSD